MGDFTVIFVCQDIKTNKIKYINKEFTNGKGYYPQNTKEDIEELLNALGYDEDLDLHELNPIDVCEVITDDGVSLWKESENA